MAAVSRLCGKQSFAIAMRDASRIFFLYFVESLPSTDHARDVVYTNSTAFLSVSSETSQYKAVVPM
jgi:hypothetical protein